MGLFDSFNNFVDSAIGTNLSGNNSGGALAGGDIAKSIGMTAREIQNIVALPGNQISNIANNNWAEFNKQNQLAIGGVVDIVTHGVTRLTSGDRAQSVLRSVNEPTGYLKNYAGYSRGVSTLANSGYISNADRNDAFQFGIKSAAAAGAAYAYSNPVIPTDAGFSVSGSELVGSAYDSSAAYISANPFTSAVVGSGVYASIQKGDAKGALEQVGIKTPEWLLPSPTNSSDHTEFGPWNSSTPSYYSGSGYTTNQSGSNIQKYVVFGSIALILGAVLLKAVK